MFINKHKKSIRILCKILFGLYICALVYFLFFAEILGRTGMDRTYHYNLILLKEIKRFVIYREQLGFVSVFLNLAGNILIFTPFGFLLPGMGRKLKSFWNVTLLSLELSMAVELVQLITRVGSCDVDDMLLNTVGGMLGYTIFVIVQRKRDKNADRLRMEQAQKNGRM